jgi:LCP family protein required for cell wall assembly
MSSVRLRPVPPPVRPGAPARGQRQVSGPPPGGTAVEQARARRRLLTLLGVSLLAPGSAQLVAGNRAVGRLALRVWLALLGVAGLLAVLWLIHPPLVLAIATVPLALRLAALICFLLAVAWPLLLLDAWRISGPGALSIRSRRAVALLVLVLTAGTCLVPFGAGRRAWAAADLIGGVFGSGRHSAAVDGRYTVLLLGGDAGPDRIGTRPDSVTLASIDERSGATTLFSLPRNLQNIPFPRGTAAARALPRGWSCGDACLLNAVYQWGSEHRQYFPGAPDPGAEAMKQAVQGVTGLAVNYYVLIDLKGFRSMIDAVGGIDLQVSQRVPIGGGTSPISGWIEPGARHLNGYRALWYARSREGSSDYQRMARQRCVMTAMVNQLDPGTLLAKFQDIAAAGRQVMSTDLPARALPTFITLGGKAKAQRIDSVQFVPPLIVPHHPDYPAIRRIVAKALKDQEAALLVAPAATPAAATPAAATPAAAATSAAPVSAPTAVSPPAPSAAPSGSAPSGSAPGTSGTTADIREVCRAG